MPTLPLALVVGCGLLAGPARGEAADPARRTAPPLPRDPARWIGAPQTWDALRGRVSLVFVWTFG